ncbi:MAG: alkaline phosphatase family protein [Pirellulaceae bacterium]
MTKQKRRVLLIGWDAADWKVIHPLMDAGKMPALQSLVNEGVMANLATLHPVLSPMLWTSIATGKRPFKHGIFGFTEPTEDGQGIRPITNLSRKVKAVWNILNQSGKTSNVVGWWPSHPAEPVNGVMVSNHYQQAVGPPEQPWPMPPGTVHPPHLSETLAELRLNPNELQAEHLLPFIPEFAEIDQEKNRRVGSCAKILAECTTVHAAATWLMEHEQADFTAVYYDAIDHFSHGFMRYHPPRREHIDEKEYEWFHGVIEAGYRYHDMMLHHLMRAAGEDTTVILMSDHGFHPDHLRPKAIPREPAGPAVEHRDFGIFVMRGPDIRRDEIIHGAGLLDIAPTILTLFGMPLGADMDGKPLLEAFEQPPDVEVIPSWENVSGESGQHPPDTKLDPIESQEAIKQLVDLGYIDQPDENREKAIARTVYELKFNLARSFIDADRHAEAMRILETLYQKEPGEYRFGIQLAMCYRALNRIAELREVVENMNELRRREAAEARAKLEQMQQTLQARKLERDAGLSTEVGYQAKPSQGQGEVREREVAADKQPLISDEERAEVARLQMLANLNTWSLDYLMGFVLTAEGDHEAALKYLHRAEQAEHQRPGLHIQIGELYLAQKQWNEAEQAFGKAAEIDPQNPHVHLGLCRSYLARSKNRLAMNEALSTVSLMYHYPMAHYLLGIALDRLNRIEEAVQALQVAIAQNPNFREAHLRLSRIFRRHYGDSVQAAEHRQLAKTIKEHRKADNEFKESDWEHQWTLAEDRAGGGQDSLTVPADITALPPADEWVTIVCGLPRSGTSMMMQMLRAGGMELLTDGVRAADEDNPQGYDEFEPVKRTRQDPSWVEQAVGKAVKMVHLLVPNLPPNRRYKVVMMRRDLDEILASQAQMLERQGRTGGDLSPQAMKRTYQQQLSRLDRWLGEHPRFEMIDMDYNQLLAEPNRHIQRLIDFLDLPGSAKQISQVIDPALYRQRQPGEIRRWL